MGRGVLEREEGCGNVVDAVTRRLTCYFESVFMYVMAALPFYHAQLPLGRETGGGGRVNGYLTEGT